MPKFIPFIVILIGLTLAGCGKTQTADEYMTKGKAFFQQGSWQSAIIEFKNAVKIEPENNNARALLGKTYLEVSNYPAAIKELERAVRLGASREQLDLPLAKAYLAVADFSSVIDKVLVSENQTLGTQARLHAVRARALLGLGQTDAAYEALKIARGIDENAQEVRLAWGRLEQERGNLGAQKDWIKPLLAEELRVADAWSQLGDIETAQENFIEAEKAYSKAHEFHGRITPDLARLALTRIELKKFKEAQADIDLLKSAGLGGPIVMFADGVVAFHQGQLEQAKTKLQEVISASPSYLPPRYLLAAIYYSEKDYKTASSHLTVFLERNPDHQAALNLQAASLVQLRKPEEALPVIEHLLEKTPNEVRLYELKGTAQLQRSDAKGAIDTFREGLRIDPNSAGLHFRLGQTLAANPKTIAESEKHFLKAKSLSPDSKQVNTALYLGYLRQKRFSDARKIAQEMSNQDTGDTTGQNLLGLTYLAEGNTDKAIGELENILKSNQSDPQTLQNLAKIYVDNARFDEAKTLLSSAAKTNPADMGVLNQLAMISGRQGDEEEMLSWLKQSMDQNPDELSPKLLLASQYLKQGDAASSIQVLNGVEENQRDDDRFVLLMAQSKLAVNEYQHSIRLLKSLLARNPDSARGNFLLALAYSKDNDVERMREALENTVKTSPKHFLANLYLARLDLAQRKQNDFVSRVKQLKTINENNPDVQYLLAKQFTLEKAYSKAIDVLERLKAVSKHPDVYLSLADNMQRSGRSGDAIKELESWLRESGPDSRVSFALAQYQMEAKQFDKARDTYLGLQSELPKNIVVLNNLAWLLKDSDASAGLDYAKRALEVEPENPLIMDTAATLYLAVSQPEKAMDLSSRAAQALPKHVEIQVNYAKALIANNKKDKARSVLERIKPDAQTEQEKQLISQELLNI